MSDILTTRAFLCRSACVQRPSSFYSSTEEVERALIEFRRTAHPASAEPRKVLPHVLDSSTCTHRLHAIHMVDGPVPGRTRLLDPATLELHLRAYHEVERDDPRIGRGRAGGRRPGVLARSGAEVPSVSYTLAVRE